MSINPTPEDNAAEVEAVLSLQEAPTAEAQDDVEAHISSVSVDHCANEGTKGRL
ncbi:hypothetical protein [Kitasatospora griseola]|uniref:hypothetical protein n=1 Tax=Kitasatospora griseola TaxID=2064 RepID=UPI0037FF3A34